MALRRGIDSDSVTHVCKGRVFFFNWQTLCLPLSKFLFELLEDRKNNFYENEFVFPGPGKSGYISPPVKPMRHVINKTGIAFCFHDLRRTFITVAESLDIPYAALKKLLNHSDGNY